jgi:hypothetical protein
VNSVRDCPDRSKAASGILLHVRRYRTTFPLAGQDNQMPKRMSCVATVLYQNVRHAFRACCASKPAAQLQCQRSSFLSVHKPLC